MHTSIKHPDDFGAFVPGPRCTRAPTGSGLLDGLSFAVKDLIDVAGEPTGGGNPDWLASQAPAATSAPAVKALLAAGAHLAGKTITDELAFSLEGVNAHYGTPVNPACPDRIPGGSSSGSAVAVAAGLVDFALGTDTGGSVRVPASFTGIFGFRPTHGRVPLAGVVPFAPSYDTVGWFAREARILGKVGAALLGHGDDTPIERLILADDVFAAADPEPAGLLRERARAWGAVESVTVFEGAADEWRECYRVVQGAEVWRNLGPWITSARPQFGDAIAPRFQDAATIAPDALAHYRAFRDVLRERMRALIRPGTGLVLPTTPGIAPRLAASGEEIGAFYRIALAITAIAGHAGLPQVTVPAARFEGCPLGLSIVGAPGADQALLAHAAIVAHRQRQDLARRQNDG